MNHIITSNIPNYELMEVIPTMETSHSCDICGKGFARFDELERHKLSHQAVKPFSCDVCGKSFAHKSHLKQHQTIHTGEKPFKCSICGFSFSRNGNLTRHMKTHGQGTVTTITTTQYENVANQTRAYPIEKPFKCNICGCAFARNGDLTRHFKTHEESLYPANQNQTQNTTTTTYQPRPAQPAPAQTPQPQPVQQTVSEENPFNCKACWKAFTERSDQDMHERIHAALLPYKCDVCGKSFSENSYLERHKKAHSEKMFSCDVCAKTFSQKYHLTVHKRTHTGERPFKCNICGFAFSRKDHLERHQRTNKLGDRKLSCVPMNNAATVENHQATLSVTPQQPATEITQQHAEVPHYINI